MRDGELLPEGYGPDDADRDRRDLATLTDASVPWRTKRRLRHRVGDEAELATRLAAWESATAPPCTPEEALRAERADAVALAREYFEVCSELWGRDDADVLANARRIASGQVLPWEARQVIRAERERAAARARVR